MAWEDAGLTLAQRDLGSLTLQVRRSKFEVITIHICRYIFLSVHHSERSWLVFTTGKPVEVKVCLCVPRVCVWLGIFNSVRTECLVHGSLRLYSISRYHEGT